MGCETGVLSKIGVGAERGKIGTNEGVNGKGMGNVIAFTENGKNGILFS